MNLRHATTRRVVKQTNYLGELTPVPPEGTTYGSSSITSQVRTSVVQGIVIDIQDVLTDESENDRNAVSLIRQIVASAGIRVPELAVQQGECFAIDSYAPNFAEALIFYLVNRDPTLALRCVTAFRKQFQPFCKIRPEARQVIETCKQQGWRVALAQAPTEQEVQALRRTGIWDRIDVKGPPPNTKITLPDVRLLEYLVGRLGGKPRECVMLGNRLGISIRPANSLRVATIFLQTGRHGQRQQPRDLKDVPTYTAADINELLQLLPNVH
jgi:FMN phosphatase YigB (HAD superfamily)